MKKIRLAVMGTALVVPLIAAGVSWANPDASDRGEAPDWAVPNPAAVYCTELGGISRSADRNVWGGSQTGLCRLQDDSVVADWTLFRAVRLGPNQAVEAFREGHWVPGTGPIETWADEACQAAGGQVADYAEHLRPSSIVRMCEFTDNSLIEIWTLFSGPDLYPTLADAVKLTAVPDTTFRPCPWPRTCMAPCLPDRPPDVLCMLREGSVEATTFACCCCGTGTNSWAPLLKPSAIEP